MSINSTVEMINLERKAKDAMNLAASRGYESPPDYVKAQSLLEAATKVRDSGGPTPEPLPAKASAVGDWIAATARSRADWQHEKDVAAELVEQLARQAYGAVLVAVPDFLRQLCDEFEALVPRFQELLAIAPRAVSGQMSTEQFELHAELLRTVESLYALVTGRAHFALLVDEGEYIGRNPLWLIIEPAGSVTLHTVRTLLEQFSGDFPRTIEDWAELNAVGLKIARSGDVARRVQTFRDLTLAAASGPDGGRLDKSYAEAAQMAGGTAHVLRNLGPDDREFVVEGVAS